MNLVQQVPFGKTGVKVSPIIVGCGTFGGKNFGKFVLDEEEKVFEILKECYDQGIRTFDTADAYSNGQSERMLGKFLKKYNIKRETVVIMTKCCLPVDEDITDGTFGDFFTYKPDSANGVRLANQRGLSRKHIIDAVKNSMERLGTYIDFFQIHRFDPDVEMKDIMKTLNWVVEQGYTRYIGASTMRASEFVELQMIADKYEWFQFSNLQVQYNLLYREDERELVPFANRHNLAKLAWSPNAGGLLTRPTKDAKSTTRGSGGELLVPVGDGGDEINKRVEEIAKKHNVSMAIISTAWVLHKGFYPIVGMNSVKRVQDAVDATKVQLTEEDIKYLEEPYKPRELQF